MDPPLSLFFLTPPCYTITERKLNPFGVTKAVVRLRVVLFKLNERPLQMPTDDAFDVSSVGEVLHCWTLGHVAAIRLLCPSVLCRVTGMNICVDMNNLC